MDVPGWAPVILAGVFGLLIGSFLNVVIWRVPRGESIVSPPSACPGCGAHIRPWDNVPVVSWFVLRGRCRDCRAPVSSRYPLVEAGTGLAFAAVTWWAGASWVLPALLYLAAVTVALTLIDLDHRRLPDAIVLPSYVVVAALLALAAWSPGSDASWGRLLGAGLGGLAMFVAYALMVLAYPKGMGLGDVKLAGVLGLVLGWYGWAAVAIGFFAAFLVGGLFSIALIVTGRATRASKVPFGPWMFLGAWVGITAGERIWQAYLSVMGL